MILYLDTSALVKLFVTETHSKRVRQAVSAAQLTVTHAIAYVEACATFARAAHARGDEALFPALRKNLDIQWRAWEILDATEPLIRRAADLAGRYRLRGYDSLHLAAAQSAFEAFRGQASFHFAVFDDRLSGAARQAGMPLLGE
ncbi:MAG: type II toxin-antitoxin system VapC family toxin [Burkholderiales bacterium]|nr:type II toxin-antitoxin system VapC family toxin [Burkholderiales bacterium]